MITEKEVTSTLDHIHDGFKNRVNATLYQRLSHLRKLEKALKDYEQELIAALKNDFNKSEFETVLTEILPVMLEIKYFKKNLKSLMKAKRVRTPLPLMPASSRIMHEAKGVVLIIGAWNYPINLTLVPLVGAIAAGNTAIVKPSELTPHTAAVLEKMIKETFKSSFVRVLQGDGDFTSNLLDHPFDHIFYTGSTQVGQLVYEKAAKQLCPVTLELGGKSPAIFSRTVNYDKAVKRLIWGKMVNAGQTCVAPDYVLVPLARKEVFLESCTRYMKQFKVENLNNQTKIVNRRHFDRIEKLVTGKHKILFGGKFDAENLVIEPTIVEIFDQHHALMQEEIFGPVLPVYFYKDRIEIRKFYEKSPNPLALYIFSKDKPFIRDTIEAFPSGGVLINDTMMHLANEKLPFGGRGTSGFGNYHGNASFECFSHTKSVMKQVNWFDVDFRYFPFTDKKLGFLRKILNFFS